jgi:hypothetical protein
MLTQEESVDIADLLVAVAAVAPSPRQFLAVGLHEHLRDHLGEASPRILVEHALDLCRQDGYRSSPPAMVQLLDKLLPKTEPVVAVIRRLRVPPPPAPDPFEALILISKLPFLDRLSTRAALKRFLLQRTPIQPVVVVNGPRRFGKTYTGEFVDHILASIEGVSHCRIELAQGQGRSTGPLELASDMVAVMSGVQTAPPPANTNADRWAQELVNWVIGVANASGRNWWFVLDGFNAHELRTDTEPLIKKLAKSLTTGIARERHRLVLTDFDRAVLPLQPGLIAHEMATAIPHLSVAAAVAQAVQLSPEPLDAAKVTAKVLEGLADPVVDLPELGQRLSDLIASVDGAAVLGGVGP